MSSFLSPVRFGDQIVTDEIKWSQNFNVILTHTQNIYSLHPKISITQPWSKSRISKVSRLSFTLNGLTLLPHKSNSTPKRRFVRMCSLSFLGQRIDEKDNLWSWYRGLDNSLHYNRRIVHFANGHEVHVSIGITNGQEKARGHILVGTRQDRILVRFGRSANVFNVAGN